MIERESFGDLTIDLFEPIARRGLVLPPYDPSGPSPGPEWMRIEAVVESWCMRWREPAPLTSRIAQLRRFNATDDEVHRLMARWDEWRARDRIGG